MIIIVVVATNFFGISQEDYYNPNDYLEEPLPLPKQLDHKSTTPTTTIDTKQNDILLLRSTFINYGKSTEELLQQPQQMVYLKITHDDDMSNLLWLRLSCNAETKRPKRNSQVRPLTCLGSWRLYL